MVKEERDFLKKLLIDEGKKFSLNKLESELDMYFKVYQENLVLQENNRQLEKKVAKLESLLKDGD